MIDVSGKSYVEVDEPGPMGGRKKYRQEYGKARKRKGYGGIRAKPRKLPKGKRTSIRRGRFPGLKKGTSPLKGRW